MPYVGVRCGLMNAQWEDVGDIIVQPIPWQNGKTNGSYFCSIFSHGTVIGSLGVQLKDDRWRYRGVIYLGRLHPDFANQEMRFKQEASVNECQTNEEVIAHAKSFYASKMLDWLIEQSKNRALHNS